MRGCTRIRLASDKEGEQWHRYSYSETSLSNVSKGRLESTCMRTLVTSEKHLIVSLEKTYESHHARVGHP